MGASLEIGRAKISGDTVLVAGITVNISGSVVYFTNNGIDNVVKISGQTIQIAGGISLSGSQVYLPNDSINNIVKISGQTVSIAGGINVSGSAVGISGQTVYLINNSINNVVKISGESVQISGQVIYNYGTNVKTNPQVSCTSLSGGTQLPNISCLRCLVRSVSGNNVMYIGGTGTQAPNSGIGLELYGGEATPIMDVNNTNVFAIYATTSGQNVSLLAIA